MDTKMLASSLLSGKVPVTMDLSEAGAHPQGVISRACEASRRLQMQNPELWRKLRVNDDDMLYFLFEEPLQNFIRMGEMLRKNPSASREFINAIENY